MHNIFAIIYYIFHCLHLQYTDSNETQIKIQYDSDENDIQYIGINLEQLNMIKIIMI